jgi:hypothetical protein
MKQSLIILIVFSVLLSACATESVVQNEPPTMMDELRAEAMIVAAEDKILYNDALVAVARAYPDFEPTFDEDLEVEVDSFFAPPPRSVKFLNCTDLDGKGYQTFGKATVTYEYNGKTRRRVFSDSCYDKMNREYYCSGNRVAFEDYKCDGSCWEERHCK